MHLDFYSFLRLLWQQQPSIIILLVAGLFVFLLLVVDCFRHCRIRNARIRVQHRRRLRDFKAQLQPLARVPNAAR
jgi:hypothetical protein